MSYERHLPDECRSGRIVEAIAEGGYDVVCLQELFDEKRRQQIADGLSAQGYWVIRKADNGDWAHEDSGLLVASRHPIDDDWHFSEYQARASADAWADKGILGCRIYLNPRSHGCTYLHLFNTHLQSQASRARVRESRLRQARRFITRHLQPTPGHQSAAILCGDFNVVEDSVEYPLLVAALRTGRDLLRVIHPNAARYPAYTWNPHENGNMMHPSDPGPERLDYVFGSKRYRVTTTYPWASSAVSTPRPPRCRPSEPRKTPSFPTISGST